MQRRFTWQVVWRCAPESGLSVGSREGINDTGDTRGVTATSLVVVEHQLKIKLSKTEKFGVPDSLKRTIKTLFGNKTCT